MATKQELDEVARRILAQDATKRAADAAREARTAAILKVLDERGPDVGFGWSAEHEDYFMRGFLGRQAAQEQIWAARSAEKRARDKRQAALSCGFSA